MCSSDLDFIREFKDYLNWKFISQEQILSEDFIREFIDNISIYYLLKNVNQKYYSIAFIKDFAPDFNCYYKYNHAANIIRNYWLPHYYKPGNAGHINAISDYKNTFCIEIVS